MTAIIQERGGYDITNAAYLNQSDLPPFDPTGGPNMTGVQNSPYQASNPDEILANVGDAVTLYMKSIDSGAPLQTETGATGHGFNLEDASLVEVVNGTLRNDDIRGGTWHTVTFKVVKEGQSLYRCTQFCSPLHGIMTGTFRAGTSR